jgi:hypothetical protein
MTANRVNAVDTDRIAEGRRPLHDLAQLTAIGQKRESPENWVVFGALQFKSRQYAPVVRYQITENGTRINTDFHGFLLIRVHP